MPLWFEKWMLASGGRRLPRPKKPHQGRGSAAHEPRDSTDGYSGFPQHRTDRGRRDGPLNQSYGNHVADPPRRSYESYSGDYDRMDEINALPQDDDFRWDPDRFESEGYYDGPRNEWDSQHFMGPHPFEPRGYGPEDFMGPARGETRFIFVPSRRFGFLPPRMPAQTPPLYYDPPLAPSTMEPLWMRPPRRRPHPPRRAVDCDTDCSCSVSESEDGPEIENMERAAREFREKRRKESQLGRLRRWFRT
ncbi:hypothetical protein PV10_03137 [Exophiala mesophila]|uniref:Uncharacterized protein n=1 Tax=Exophiala mesophila TaxID=212818 RepID=A0A0D1X129_EXOME|nr:uncharacterized protein PV10_03137 [Exophiala mesophila]KIV95485.1 hypothetical protein PV10_03137 [Exophiala mesophila]